MTWTLEGENNSAAQTKRFKSVIEPLLVFGEEDSHDMLVLDKVVPGPLHLYLGCNEVINHSEKTCWSKVKDVLSDRVGVQVHVYQGKIGNYEGPSLQKIFRKLSSLEEFIVDEPKKLYFQTLISFRAVSRSVIGKELLVT